jgi:hypothetical protein
LISYKSSTFSVTGGLGFVAEVDEDEEEEEEEEEEETESVIRGDENPCRTNSGLFTLFSGILPADLNTDILFYVYSKLCEGRKVEKELVSFVSVISELI